MKMLNIKASYQFWNVLKFTNNRRYTIKKKKKTCNKACWFSWHHFRGFIWGFGRICAQHLFAHSWPEKVFGVHLMKQLLPLHASAECLAGSEVWRARHVQWVTIRWDLFLSVNDCSLLTALLFLRHLARTDNSGGHLQQQQELNSFFQLKTFPMVCIFYVHVYIPCYWGTRWNKHECFCQLCPTWMF